MNGVQEVKYGIQGDYIRFTDFDYEGLGERMNIARLQLEATSLGRVTWDEIARRVNERYAGRTGEGIDGSQLSQYSNARVRVPIGLILAYAQVCGVDPGWLAFGDGSGAPEPPILQRGPPRGAGPSSEGRPVVFAPPKRKASERVARKGKRRE